MSLNLKLENLISKYKNQLESKIDERVKEMKDDLNEHYLIYKALGIDEKEGELIDVYQNKGRFVYKYIGSLLEEAAKLCIENVFSDAETVRIPNTLGSKPKTFEIDCLVNKKDAIEIKWRDATRIKSL